MRAEADEAAAEAARARDERQEAAQRARRAADALAGLAYRLRERAGWQARLRELADEAAESEARAEACLERARAADEDRRGRPARRRRRPPHRPRAARRARRDRRRPRRRCRTATRTPPARPLPALREAYRAASQLYEKVGVGADLRAEQARAESDESAALAELDRLTNKVRTRAAQLLESPGRRRRALPAGRRRPCRVAGADAGDPRVGRQRAARPAARRGRAARPRRRRGAHRAARGAGARATPSTPRRCCAPPPPNSPPAPRRWSRPGTRTPSCSRAHRAAEDAAGGFDETAALLRDLLREHHDGGRRRTEPEPYPGSPEEARQAAAEARRSLRGCAADLSAAEAAVREASDVLVRHANSTRYEQVRTPARQQIRELPAAALPEHAAEVGGRLRAPAAGADRRAGAAGAQPRLHRGPAARAGGVRAGHAALRAAAVPAARGAGRVVRAGVPADPLRGARPGDAHRAARRGHRRGDPRRRARRTPTCGGTACPCCCAGSRRRCSRKGVAVEILKPDAVLRAERVPVGQMGDVFSGGQLLTAAIALYCTMAALRSNDRGRDKHRHAGTLFLDNPIGRANATYLLELQRAVVRRAGRPAALHHRPVRHHGARRVPAGHPAAQRRGPAGRA